MPHLHFQCSQQATGTSVTTPLLPLCPAPLASASGGGGSMRRRVLGSSTRVGGRRLVGGRRHSAERPGGPRGRSHTPALRAEPLLCGTDDHRCLCGFAVDKARERYWLAGHRAERSGCSCRRAPRRAPPAVTANPRPRSAPALPVRWRVSSTARRRRNIDSVTRDASGSPTCVPPPGSCALSPGMPTVSRAGPALGAAAGCPPPPRAGLGAARAFPISGTY